MRWLALVALTLVLVACGSAKEAAPRAKKPSRSCVAAGVPGFRTCQHLPYPTNPTIERKTASGWKVVARTLSPPEPSAQWRTLSLSPDGKTLLAEWSYPCDSAAVVFVPAAGGRARIATGERDWRKAPSARALGWTRDGRARVKTFGPSRGRPPGVYLIDPAAPATRGKLSRQSGC